MMKKFPLIGGIILSSLLYAGGDIAPIESEIEPIPTEVSVDTSSFYLGVGISPMKLHNDLTDEEFSTPAVTLQAGYQYNSYIALEARYTASLSKVEYDAGNTSNISIDDFDTDFTNAGIYLKPIYPVTQSFNIYALLGYGEVSLTAINGADRAQSGFQWGLGAQYQITEALSIFADYTNLYDDQEFDYLGADADHMADMLSVGVSYRF
jgi:opacity protein-like surface antigen